MTLTKITGANLLGNRESLDGTDRMLAQNRLTGYALDPQFAVATKDEIGTACKLAREAFPTYSEASPADRARFLEAIATKIMALGDPLLERIMPETALPLARLAGERERTCGQLRMFAKLIREGSWVDARIDTAQADRTPAPKPDIRRMLVPMGPVAVFGASNFPLAFSVAGGDTASALASGCTVVVKSNPGHLGGSEMVGRAVLEAAEQTGMPEGVFSLLHGGPEVAQALVLRDEIEAVGFTGSRKAGRALYDLACSRPRPIPVFAEMGSINPVFLLPGALGARGPKIAFGYTASLTLGVGQFCTNPGLVVGIESPEFGAFCKEAAKLLSEDRKVTMLTDAIRENYVSAIAARNADPRLAQLVHCESGDTTPAASLHVVSCEDFLADPKLSDEVFGPAALAVKCKSFAQMRTVAASLEGQLTASVHADPIDREEAGVLLPILARVAGRVIMNDFPTGVEVCPSMQHGGPYPATTDSRGTSVGTAAIFRFTRPVAWQNVEESLLPPELRRENPLGIVRLVDGVYTDAPA